MNYFTKYRTHMSWWTVNSQFTCKQNNGLTCIPVRAVWASLVFLDSSASLSGKRHLSLKNRAECHFPSPRPSRYALILTKCREGAFTVHLLFFWRRETEILDVGSDCYIFFIVGVYEQIHFNVTDVRNSVTHFLKVTSIFVVSFFPKRLNLLNQKGYPKKTLNVDESITM